MALFSVALVFSYKYKTEVVNFLVSELNKRVDTKINVDVINFSIIRNFPNASLEFTNISIKSSADINLNEFKDAKTKNFLQADKVFLKFGILDVLSKNYKISEIKIENGKINFLTDSKNKNNYNFWSENKKNDTSSFKIKLNNLIIKDSHIFFNDINSNFSTNFHTKKIELSGDFSDENFSIKTKIKAHLNDLTIEEKNYLIAQPIEIEVDLSGIDEKYLIKNGKVILSNNKFKVEGNVNFSKSTFCDLKISAKKLQIESILNIFNKKIQDQFSDFEMNGKLNFTSSVIGEISKNQSPRIDANFEITDGIFLRKKTIFNLSKIDMVGSFSNGKEKSTHSATLEANSFSAYFEKSRIKGIFILKNFNKPNINFKIESEIDLEDMHKSVNFSQLNTINGNLEAKLQGFGMIYFGENVIDKSLSKLDISGEMFLKNTNLLLKYLQQKFTNINANIIINKGLLSTENLEFVLNNSKIQSSVSIQNPLKYFFEENEKLQGNIQLNTNYINLTEILEYQDFAEQSNFHLPENVSINLITGIEKFEYKNFKADKLKASVLFLPKAVQIKSFKCNSMEGNISLHGKICENHNTNFNLNIKTQLKNIEIADLFQSFDNFGQNFIINKNVRGKLNLNLELQSDFTSSFSVIDKSIESLGDFEITNGELIDFEPIKKMSDFIELSELEHIKFSKLKNTLNIKNEKVMIPFMDIHSSAFNISISGEHTFNHIFSYELEIFLKEILGKRFKRKRNFENEFGIIEEEKSNETKIFLKVVGNEDDYKFSFNRKRAKKSVVENLKKEKEEIKEIILDEFEILKKDTSASIKIKQNKIDEENKFQPVWEEFENQKDTIKKKKKKSKNRKSKKKKLQIEWEDK